MYAGLMADEGHIEARLVQSPNPTPRVDVNQLMLAIVVDRRLSVSNHGFSPSINDKHTNPKTLATQTQKATPKRES
jgi:hypothetical protein